MVSKQAASTSNKEVFFFCVCTRMAVDHGLVVFFSFYLLMSFLPLMSVFVCVSFIQSCHGGNYLQAAMRSFSFPFSSSFSISISFSDLFFFYVFELFFFSLFYVCFLCRDKATIYMYRPLIAPLTYMYTRCEACLTLPCLVRLFFCHSAQ